MKSASRERNSGDQSDLEVIDGQAKTNTKPSSSKAKADTKPPSTKTADAVPRKIENAKEIPEITVSSPESSSPHRRDDADIRVKAEEIESFSRTTPVKDTEAPPPGPSVVEQSSGDTEAPTEPLRWDNLWEEAYEGLKSKPEYTDLVADFEQHLLEGEDGVAKGRHPHFLA